MSFPVTALASDLLNQSYWAIGARIAGIHVNTLYSIAVQESGMRWDDGSFRPWPWSLYVNETKKGIKKGSYRFGTREAAENTLNSFLRKGVNNIDVGLMQVNLRWHQHRVATPTHLLNPLTNVRVAASILKDVNNGDGPAGAVARYHSFNPRLGIAYLSRVKHFEKMVNRLPNSQSNSRSLKVSK